MKYRRFTSGVTAGLAFFFCLQLVAANTAGAQPTPPAPQPEAFELPEIVARVNGEGITRQELRAQAEIMRSQAVQAGQSDPGQTRQFLTVVLDAMISERLVYADSKSRGVGPSEAAIDKGVQDVIAAYQGEEGFERVLKAQGLDRGYVRKQVSQSLSFDHMMNQEIKPGIEVGEEAVQAFYDQNKDTMKVPVLYRVRRIMKRIPTGAGAEIGEAVRTQLEALRQQAIDGADFAALAKEHSDDEGTREQGGEIPWFPLTGRGGRLETLIAELEVGQVSEVVETGIGGDVGLFLLRLEDIRPERIKTLEEARGEILNVLAATEARRVIQDRIQRLRADAQVEILM